VPSRGEVWLVDLGMIQKVRPALILNRSFKDEDRFIPAHSGFPRKQNGSQKHGVRKMSGSYIAASIKKTCAPRAKQMPAKRGAGGKPVRL